MTCPVCSAPMKFAFKAKVLQKYEARYEVCDACGFLRAHEPHWLDEAYSRAIAAADTGLLARNISLAGKLAGALYWAMGERGHGRYLDSAGGYGVLTRLMRDRGFNFYWTDKHCENLLAPGYEYGPELGACLAVTAMEVLEHLTDPMAFIADALSTAGAQALLSRPNFMQDHRLTLSPGGTTRSEPGSTSVFSKGEHWKFWAPDLVSA